MEDAPAADTARPAIEGQAASVAGAVDVSLAVHASSGVADDGSMIRAPRGRRGRDKAALVLETNGHINFFADMEAKLRNDGSARGIMTNAQNPDYVVRGSGMSGFCLRCVSLWCWSLGLQADKKKQDEKTAKSLGIQPLGLGQSAAETQGANKVALLCATEPHAPCRSMHSCVCMLCSWTAMVPLQRRRGAVARQTRPRPQRWPSDVRSTEGRHVSRAWLKRCCHQQDSHVCPASRRKGSADPMSVVKAVLAKDAKQDTATTDGRTDGHVTHQHRRRRRRRKGTRWDEGAPQSPVSRVVEPCRQGFFVHLTRVAFRPRWIARWAVVAGLPWARVKVMMAVGVQNAALVAIAPARASSRAGTEASTRANTKASTRANTEASTRASTRARRRRSVPMGDPGVHPRLPPPPPPHRTLQFPTTAAQTPRKRRRWWVAAVRLCYATT